MTRLKLLSEQQMEGVRKVAEMALTTPVTILRRTGDTGLDDTDDPYGSSVSFTEMTSQTSVYGWLHSTPTPMQQIDNGMLVTFNTYRLFLPHDCNISPGDRVVIGSSEYVVSDTTANETWPAMLTCTLRLKE